MDGRQRPARRTRVHGGFWLLFVCLLMESAQVLAEPLSDEDELAAIESAITLARFDEARERSKGLLTRSDLVARTRNEALELLTIATLASRDERAARASLEALYARDPAHALRVRDPGPSVDAAFARVRAAPPERVSVLLQSSVRSDPRGRSLLEVSLGAGRDAVHSVHLFVRTADEPEPAHLVALVGTRERVTFPLVGAANFGATTLYHLRAEAPSGALLGTLGSELAPLSLSLPHAARPATRAVPIHRAWWLWTSLAVVIAGASVSGAIVAR